MSLVGTEVSDWQVLSMLETKFLMTLKMMAICQGVSSSGIPNNYALFVTHNGDMYAAGNSSHGCLGLGDITETKVPVQIRGISKVIGVSTSGTYGDVLVCTSEGQIYAWGRNIKETLCKIPTLLEDLKSVMVSEVACCRGHYLALTTCGKVYEWRGVNTWSALSKTPTQSSLDAVVVNIACGASHSLALSQNGDVYFWGVNWNSDGLRSSQPIPGIMDLRSERVLKVACGGDHSIALLESGKVVTWGSNGYGQLGTGNTKNSLTPVKIVADYERFVDIAANSHLTSAGITEAGAVYMWGKGENDVKFLTPTVTKYKEMHQVFAKCSRSSFIWTCNTCGEVSLVIEECHNISKELQSSFNNEEESDLTLIVDNIPIHVHRGVLNERSQYFFHSMLHEFWTRSDQREIKLESYGYDIYLSYLRFLYTGVLKSTTDNLLGLWDLANAFGEDNLRQGCETLLKRNLSMEKVALFYSRAITKKSKECNMWKKENAELHQELEKYKSLENECLLWKKKNAELQEELNGLKALYQNAKLQKINEDEISSILQIEEKPMQNQEQIIKLQQNLKSKNNRINYKKHSKKNKNIKNNNLNQFISQESEHQS